MAETPTRTETTEVVHSHDNIERTRQLLRVVYGAFPIVAGLDKFTNVLAVWTDFLPPIFVELLPVSPQMFMYIVGTIEIIAGLFVLWRTEYGAYLVAAWLVGIAVTQVIAGSYDIAVRDLWIAVGAVALAQLSATTGTE